MTICMQGADLVYAGKRSPQETGDSITVSVPKRELRREGVDPEELLEKDVRVVVDEDLVMHTDLGELLKSG